MATIVRCENRNGFLVDGVFVSASELIPVKAKALRCAYCGRPKDTKAAAACVSCGAVF